jgi:hypothetical protein
MLLGQADAGKSTLRKQFQLFYTSQAMDNERPSWRPIVYFNVIKAVRMILDELSYDNSQSPSSPSSPSIDHEPSPHSFLHLRRRLQTLVAMEETLFSELSCGVSVSGGGGSDVFVRAGRQSAVTQNRNWPTSRNSYLASERAHAVADLVAAALSDLQWDVDALWRDPSVKALIRLRKLRLDESAPL